MKSKCHPAPNHQIPYSPGSDSSCKSTFADDSAPQVVFRDGVRCFRVLPSDEGHKIIVWEARERHKYNPDPLLSRHGVVTSHVAASTTHRAYAGAREKLWLHSEVTPEHEGGAP